MSLSNYAEGKLRDHVLGKAAFPMPTVYVAMFTADPGETGDQTNEVTGGSYARQPATFTNGLNDAAITIPGLPAVTVTHVAFCDAVTAGNILWSGPLDTPVLMPDGADYTFDPGTLGGNLD